MSVSRSKGILTVDNSQFAIRVEFYFSDAAATPPHAPRLRFTLTAIDGSGTIDIDRPLSDYSNPVETTANRKAIVQNALSGWFSEMLTLEGFA